MSEKFECDECGYKSNKKYNLTRHKKLKHGEKEIISDDMILDEPIAVEAVETLSSHSEEEEEASFEDYILSLVKEKAKDVKKKDVDCIFANSSISSFVFGLGVGYLAKGLIQTSLNSLGEGQYRSMLMARLNAVPPVSFQNPIPPSQPSSIHQVVV